MTGSRRHHALLLARTLRHLRPAQVAHRARLRARRALTARFPDAVARRLRRTCPDRPAWPEGFLPIDGRVAEGFPSAEANAEGRFCFLAESRDVGDDWAQAGASRLWRYHLHYFEWAWAVADQPDRDWASSEYRRLWRSWRAGSPFGRGDAWSPYVVSLRAWVLCALYAPLVAGTDDEEDYLEDVALHAGFVRAHLELDVGGNHLIKNLKALIGLGLFLDDDDLLRAGSARLGHQLGVQVLADGGHFERSPSYHCQVLSDLLDVRDLLATARRPLIPGLGDAIQAMRAWLGVMLLPDGDVPLFNDCTLVGHDRLKLLEPPPPPPRRLVVLEPSGYVVMRPDERAHLVADVGSPCPPELPAHAHADCLSFELAVDGERSIVNSGTSTYEAGPRRDHERSTAAHNTVEIDGEDQTEVWGTFRAARRATPRIELAAEWDGDMQVTASHDGYQRLPGSPRHRRTWRASPGRIEITDDVDGTGTHRVVARL
ncbi:MAG: heparinase II/III family protein, partial [Actinomycetota bacterium]|nr:heparinase II/III family protein [Actinomycetota bacterium]